jgi:hypothetical protein
MVQGYTLAPPGFDLALPEPLRIVVNSAGGWLSSPADARGIHHWGGLDTFDPYVLH